MGFKDIYLLPHNDIKGGPQPQPAASPSLPLGPACSPRGAGSASWMVAATLAGSPPPLTSGHPHAHIQAHLQPASAADGYVWRNGIDMDPLAKYGPAGRQFSYMDVLGWVSCALAPRQ
jgi:hypothetical protein